MYNLTVLESFKYNIRNLDTCFFTIHCPQTPYCDLVIKQELSVLRDFYLDLENFSSPWILKNNQRSTWGQWLKNLLQDDLPSHEVKLRRHCRFSPNNQDICMRLRCSIDMSGQKPHFYFNWLLIFSISWNYEGGQQITVLWAALVTLSWTETTDSVITAVADVSSTIYTYYYLETKGLRSYR